MSRARGQGRGQGRGAVVALASLASFVAATAIARDAAAQCVGSRPTDPEGYANQTYGTDTVGSYATQDLRVHYASNGKHAVDPKSTGGDGVPDTVRYAGDIGQAALTKFAAMGFRAIPRDGACPSNGGDDKIDIYLVKFAGADGSTAPEACEGAVCSSFMLVDSTFKNRGYPSIEDGFRTVVVHELFHAVQNAYDREMDRFWAEGTAQWAMKTLHPELTDFEHQLPAFFQSPRQSLDSPPSGVTAGYLYGAAVWPLFLSLRHGESIVREILEAEAGAAGAGTIPATETALGAKGSSIATEFPLFAAWNAATKKYAGAGGYPDAAEYPGVATTALEDGAAGITSGLSSFAYVGTLTERSGLSLETDAARNAGLVVPIEGGKAQLDRATTLPANAEGEVLVIVAGVTTKKTDAKFVVRIGAPIEAGGASSSSSGGSSSGDDGGCHTARSAPIPTEGGLAVALGTIAVLVVGRRRSRVTAGQGASS